MKKRNLIWLLIAGGVAYWLWSRRGAHVAPEKVVAGPTSGTGLTPTGRAVVTDNGRHPDYPEEVSGYGLRKWMEVTTPDGRTTWVEDKE